MKHCIDHETVIDGLIYKIANPDYHDQIIDFYFDSFLSSEPSTVAFGGYKDRPASIVKQVEDIIDDGISIIALDPMQDNKLAGIFLCHSVKKDKLDPRGSYKDHLKTFPHHYAAIMALFDEVLYPGDIFAAHPEDSKYYDMFALGTHQDYRGKGLAKNMVNESLKVAKKADCSAAIVLATNDITRRISTKLGMEFVAAKGWNYCIYNGRPAFGDVKSDMASGHYLKIC